MNRPRIVGILSAALGSAVGFAVLSRWHLAGTITGAILMPVIFTLVSFGSHESLDKAVGWLRRHTSRRSRLEEEAAATDDALVAAAEPPQTSEPQVEKKRPAAHSLHWSVITLACLAFAVSVYSLTHAEGGTTILREKVVQTVTVTSVRSAIPVAQGAGDGDVTGAGGATTTTMPAQGQDDPSATTVSTVAGQATTTTTLP